jgi:hypothetical protein
MRAVLAWLKDTTAGRLTAAGAIVVLVVAALFVRWALTVTPSVERYCSYGAVSEAQLRGCESHVTVSDVRHADSNAGRYGRYQMDECLTDSGPFCGGISSGLGS